MELQIKEMKKYEDSLSRYKKIRLANMRERQMMVEMLNFNEDKEAIYKKITESERRAAESSGKWRTKLERRMLKEELGRVGRDRILAGLESGDPEPARGFLILSKRQ